jgi:hypothetical protein
MLIGRSGQNSQRRRSVDAWAYQWPEALDEVIEAGGVGRVHRLGSSEQPWQLTGSHDRRNHVDELAIVQEILELEADPT